MTKASSSWGAEISGDETLVRSAAWGRSRRWRSCNLDNDPRRLRRSRDAGARMGLRPKRRDSGERSPQLSITKTGDRLLRRLLVQCAQYILGRHGTDSALRRWGLRLAARGGPTAKRKAIVAVARKLAVVMHVLWRRDEVFDPFHGMNPRPADSV